MLRVSYYDGPAYYTSKKGSPRRDYIRVDWDNGHIDMQLAKWEKLSMKKKNLILKLG